MNRQFQNRTEAGRVLAQKLARYAGRNDVLVLALPRGGVPVGYEIARELHAPFDVFIVRKLGVPGHEELAMGAIATGGIRILNASVIEGLQIPESVIERTAEAEQRELERRERVYRPGRPAPDVRGRTIILVDDGIATGSTMRAAIAALRRQDAARIVVATPVVSLSTYGEMATEADELLAAITPEEFLGVGQWYQDFSQTSDAEVRELLARAEHERKVA